jgi:hypothetical protein
MSALRNPPSMQFMLLEGGAISIATAAGHARRAMPDA